MSFTISMNFNGNCREAVIFYAKVFKRPEPQFLTYAEMNTSFDPNVRIGDEDKEHIANVQLSIGGTLLSFSDMPGNFEFIRGNNLALCVLFPTFKEAEDIFLKLGKEGTIFVPLTKKNPQYSLLTDKFNVTWNISVE